MTEWGEKRKKIHEGGVGVIYFLGMIGVFIYYFQLSSNMTELLTGAVKAILWPAFFTYHIYKFLGMN